MNALRCVAFLLGSTLALAPLTSACGRDRISDASVTQSVSNRLASERELGAYNVQVSARDGVVVLTGQVGQEQQRAEAERIAWDTPGVEKVSNQIQVGSMAPGVPGVGAPAPEAGDPPERE